MAKHTSQNDHRIVFVSTEHSHHSAFSGYGRLVGHLGWGNRQVVLLKRELESGNRGWRTGEVFGRAKRALGRRLLAPYTTSDALFLDLRLALRNASLVHHLYGEDTCLLSPILGKSSSGRVTATLHLPPSTLDLRSRPIWLAAIKELDGILVVSSTQKEYLARQLNGTPRVEFIPHGVEIDRFTVSTYERRNCLLVGHHLRDFSTTYRIAESVPDLAFDLVLPSVTPRHWYTLFRTLRNVRIHMGIPDEELLNLYQTSSMACLPALDFTASNFLLEAMASGLPMVASDVGGMRDYVNEDCCILAEKGRAEQMCEAITYLLEDSSAISSMGSSGRKRAEELSWRALSSEYERFFREVVG